MKIKIRKNGDVELLYTDAIPLRDLGTVEVRRASEVEFDNRRGGWTVKFAPESGGGWLGECSVKVDSEAASEAFPSRAGALAAEVNYLEAHL